MRLALLSFLLATLASACARPIIYACGHLSASPPPATVDVRAAADRGYALEIVHVDGPGRGSTYCSPPAYGIGEDASLIELRDGEYALLAKAQDTASPYAFPLGGQVSVESGRCYVPAMTCDGPARPDATVCRLVLKNTACASRWLPRRVVLSGVSGC